MKVACVSHAGTTGAGTGGAGSGGASAATGVSISGGGAGSAVGAGGAGVMGASITSGAGLDASTGSSGTAGASGVSKRAVAAELAGGGATTLAILEVGAFVAAGKALSSDCALGAGTDKRKWATVGNAGCSRTLREVERVCKPSKCTAITSATKPQTQGRGNNDAV